MKHIVLCIALLALPAQGKIALTVQSEAGKIDLHDEPGICLGDAMRAEFVTPAGAVTPGCWTVKGTAVFVVFLDGDVARIPVGALKAPTSV